LTLPEEIDYSSYRERGLMGVEDVLVLIEKVKELDLNQKLEESKKEDLW